jgi:hypothetical protein
VEVVRRRRNVKMAMSDKKIKIWEGFIMNIRFVVL